MAKTKGHRCKLYDGSDLIPAMKSADLTENMGQEDISATDDGVDATFYGATISDGDQSIDCWYDPANAVQAGLLTKLRAGTPISLVAIWSGTKGSGTAIGTSFTFALTQAKRSSGGVKGYQGLSITGKVSGAVTDSSTL
jgi:hypothetical protein